MRVDLAKGIHRTSGLLLCANFSGGVPSEGTANKSLISFSILSRASFLVIKILGGSLLGSYSYGESDVDGRLCHVASACHIWPNTSYEAGRREASPSVWLGAPSPFPGLSSTILHPVSVGLALIPLDSALS